MQGFSIPRAAPSDARARTLASALLAAGALALAACSPEPTAVPSPGRGSDATLPDEGSSATGFPRELIGADGERCVISALPQRILPTNAGAFDDLAPLVDPSRLAAYPSQVAEYGNFDAEQEGWSDVRTFDRFEGETLLTLEPDLVISHSWQSAATLATLRGAGVPVLTIEVASSSAQILEVVRTLGRATGSEERAEERVAELEARMRGLSESSGPRRELRALSYSNLGTGGWAAADGTTMGVVFELVGMQNAADDLGLTQHAKLSFEQLLTIDPDVIVVGGGIDDYRGNETLSLLRGSSALQGLRAVREDRFVVLPSKLHSTNSSYLVTAAEVLAARVDELLTRLAGPDAK